VTSTSILPGSTIGFLGGGQLGRMTAFAARSMGYDVHVLDPDAHCPMAPVSSRVITAPFSDVDAAADLASRCDVVTLEIEQIHPDVLDAVAARTQLRPGRAPVYIIQDRVRQKEWLSSNGFPVGAFRAARSASEIATAVGEFGASIAKSCHGGYDGRGQVRLSDVGLASATWNELGSRECLVEQQLRLAYEISVLVARSASGAMAVYPPSRNHHTRGILTWAVVPADIPPDMSDAASALAAAIAERIDIVGLLAVECFVTTDGRLLVNELAPRPHNTYHHSERACVTGQFEQLVRAVCNLPLGDTSIIESGAIVNVLGDAWLHASAPDLPAALDVPTLRVHLYGKASARAGRKMGHLSALGDSAQESLGRVLDAYRRMSADTSDSFDVHEPDLRDAVRAALASS
jgi:5-(carboxyamino)imidazole ribonucleotide synthase